METDSNFIISVVRGDSLIDTPLANEILALDHRNMGEILKAIGLLFPKDKRLANLFHPSNRIILAKRGRQLAGYIDYCHARNNPGDLYLSSIQIEKSFQGGPLFRLLVSHLLLALRSEKFNAIRTNIQKSNSRMIAIATKLGLKVEERPKGVDTLNVFADRALLESPAIVRLFGFG